jgi:hypothetical protein
MTPEEKEAKRQRHNEWARGYYTPEDHRRRNLKHKYDRTPEEVDEQLRQQGGVCALCRRPPFKGRKMVVDHDHETGRFRGVLHIFCNTMLGRMNDDPVLFRDAASYLEGTR